MRIAALCHSMIVPDACSKYCLYVVLLYVLCAFYGSGMLVVCYVLVILCVCKYIIVVMVLICVSVFFCSIVRAAQPNVSGVLRALGGLSVAGIEPMEGVDPAPDEPMEVG